MTAARPAARLVLIRHGEAHANVGGVLGGHHGCTGLTRTGRAQAALLRDRLLASGELADAQALTTSLLARAIQTAQVISPALGDGGLTPQPRCDLCDVHWGAADGAALDALPRDASAFDPVAEGGESWLAFSLRCRRALAALAGTPASHTVVAVTHGGVIKASLDSFGPEHARAYRDAEIGYTAVTIWSRRPGDPRWELTAFNDSAHLEG